MNERYQQVLGLGKYQPKEPIVCFTPWVGEFGWYIMNHVKRVHGYNHSKKIVCIKPGHECLFPTASEFFYDWVDERPDDRKAGVSKFFKIEKLKQAIIKKYGKNVRFLHPEDTGWREKTSLALHTFVPDPKTNFGLDVDIVITPRKRQLERVRNYIHWQKLVDGFVKHGWSVGVCGHRDSSYILNKVKHNSWTYGDVNADVEMIRKCKVVVGQESGLAYLTMMCRKPLYIMDRCHKNIADAHRDHRVFFKPFLQGWSNPQRMVIEMKRFMHALNFNKGK